MRPKEHSLKRQLNIRLERLVADSRSCPSNRLFLAQNNRRTLLLTLIVAGTLLAESIAITGHCLAQVSPFEYQLSKLRAQSARFEQEKDELIRHQQIESSRVASYNMDLSRIVSEFQNHIADQHHHFVSCKKCRQLTKQISALSKKIERGVR